MSKWTKVYGEETSTSSMDGYDTPYAFDKDEESHKKRVSAMVKRNRYSIVSEHYSPDRVEEFRVSMLDAMSLLASEEPEKYDLNSPTLAPQFGRMKADEVIMQLMTGGVEAIDDPKKQEFISNACELIGISPNKSSLEKYLLGESTRSISLNESKFDNGHEKVINRVIHDALDIWSKQVDKNELDEYLDSDSFIYSWVLFIVHATPGRLNYNKVRKYIKDITALDGISYSSKGENTYSLPWWSLNDKSQMNVVRKAIKSWAKSRTDINEVHLLGESLKLVDMLEEENYPELKKDESKSAEQKIREGVKNINGALYQVEMAINRYAKLKNEMAVSNGSFVKSTKTRLLKLETRIGKIATKLKEIAS